MIYDDMASIVVTFEKPGGRSCFVFFLNFPFASVQHFWLFEFGIWLKN